MERLGVMIIKRLLKVEMVKEKDVWKRIINLLHMHVCVKSYVDKVWDFILINSHIKHYTNNFRTYIIQKKENDIKK